MNGKALTIDGTVGTAGLAYAAWAYFLGHPLEVTAGLLGIVLIILRILVTWREWKRLG